MPWRLHTVTLTTPGGSVQGTFTVVASLIEPLMDIQLQAGEDRVLPISIAPDAAPPGGLSLSVQVSNPALVSVPSQIFIPEGSTQTELRLLAASTAVGETVITIESPVLPAVSLNVVVSNEVTTQDGIKIIDSLNDAVMVASMAKVYSVLLGRSDHGGVNIQLSSNRTDTVLFSALEVADSAMPSPVYELFVPDGMSRADFLVHGAPLASGSAILTATHDDFLPAQLTVTLVQPSVDLVIAGVLSLSNLLSEFLQPNALSPNLPLTLSMTYDGCQTPADLAGLPCGFDRLFVSPLAGSLPVELHSSDSDVAGFVSANQFSATHTIEVPIYTNSVPAFGVESTLAIDFVSAGTATLSATIAGYAQGSGFTPVTLTVSKPAISILPTRLTPLAVGEEASYQLLLLPSGFSLIGSQSGHDALTVSVSSDDPAAIQLASEPGGVFQDTIELTIPANQFSATFQVRGVQASPDANILITDDAFQPASFPVPVTNVPLTFSSQPIQQEQTNITEE